jgi:hypothetical protein
MTTRHLVPCTSTEDSREQASLLALPSRLPVRVRVPYGWPQRRITYRRNTYPNLVRAHPSPKYYRVLQDPYLGTREQKKKNDASTNTCRLHIVQSLSA